ncbi:MAG: threonine--tRNA ligase [Candidatus Hodarchaeales archaeon]|jgi:threonyl-tRNA synthetase
MLLVHSDGIEVERKGIATASPEDIPNNKSVWRIEGKVLVAFATVEDQDTFDIDLISIQAAETILEVKTAIEDFPKQLERENAAAKKFNEALESGKAKGHPRRIRELVGAPTDYRIDTIVVYPWAHLSKFISKDKQAAEVCPKIAAILREEGVNATSSPFGWYKAFKLNCLGHELAEVRREIELAIAPDEHPESHFFVITEDGREVAVSYNAEKRQIDFEEQYQASKDFIALLKDELGGREIVGKRDPPHISLMRQKELVDFDPNSDQGNFRWFPYGIVVRHLLRDYLENEMHEIGAFQVDTPLMYSAKNPILTAQTARFPARSYWTISGSDRYIMRYAGDFLQFFIFKEMNLKEHQLPARMYEYEAFDYRREQEGELSGFRRLRAFTMPNLHTCCSNLDQAKQEFQLEYEVCTRILRAFELDFEIIFRLTQDFYDKNRDWLRSLIKTVGKPALIEIWPQRYFYFVLKFEGVIIDSLGKNSALPTIQIDEESALPSIEQGGKERPKYGIEFTRKDNSKGNPIILHTSPSGAIERIIYGILERAVINKARNLVPGFPVWLAPIQVRVIPVRADIQAQIEKGNEIVKQLSRKRFRADIDDRDHSLGRRIRKAEKEWIPYIIVIGDREVEQGSIPVRARMIGKPLGDTGSSRVYEDWTIDHLLSELKEKCKDKPKRPLPKSMQSLRQKLSFL